MNTKLRTIALNTFGSLLRDRLLIIFLVIFLCVILLMMTPLITAKARTTASNANAAQSYVLELVSMIMYFVTGFGSLLAAWLAADSVSTEMKSGTILAVMARPVKRWHFLLGKYLGVMLMMTLYVVMMFGLSYLLAWMGGQRIQSTPWVLIAYPMVRYSVYASLGVMLVTFMHPVVSWGITLLIAVLAALVAPGEPLSNHKLQVLKDIVYVVLPSTDFLSEDRFLTIRNASLRQTSWTEHLTTLCYGADYALVLLLLAMWSFHYRSLKRD